MFPRLFPTLFFFLLTASGFAYEVDNFTDRDQLKQDALPVLNQTIHSIFEKAARGVQKERGNECNAVFLRQEILRWIRPDPAGQLEIWLELTNQIQHTRIGITKSIYQNVSFKDAPILRVVGIGRSMLLNGTIVGTDKIGHFFMQGLGYYDLVKNGKPIEKVLSENHQEEGLWGLATSGVKSYSDMATNYQGYRFWSQLTQGENPYFKCDEKKGWVLSRNFTWADYVNPAWDEALNCSEMKPAIQAKVDQYLGDRGWTCPLRPSECVKISRLDHSEYFISPKCRQSAETEINRDHLFSGDRALSRENARTSPMIDSRKQ